MFSLMLVRLLDQRPARRAPRAGGGKKKKKMELGKNLARDTALRLQRASSVGLGRPCAFSGAQPIALPRDAWPDSAARKRGVANERARVLFLFFSGPRPLQTPAPPSASICGGGW